MEKMSREEIDRAIEKGEELEKLYMNQKLTSKQKELIGSLTRQD